MKTKTIVSVFLALTLTVLVMGLSPTPTLAARNAFQFRSTGMGASAGFSTCPNGVCTDTFIFVSEEMFRENGTRFSSTTLCLEQFTFDSDTGEFISQTFGCADAALSINKKLARASASTSVPLFQVVCTEEDEHVIVCVEEPTGQTVTVNVSWTGAGKLERSLDNFHFNSRNFTLNAHFRGTFRNATASGQVNGASLGATLFANMFDFKSGQMFVCHGGC